MASFGWASHDVVYTPEPKGRDVSDTPMKKLALASSAIAFGIALSAFSQSPLWAQQASPDREAKPAAAPATPPRPWPPRLKDGQPNVQGVWDPTQGRGGGSVCGGTYLEPTTVVRGTTTTVTPGCVIDPSDGLIPYQPWARARRDEVKERYLKPNAAQVDTRTRGWPDGLPRQNYYHAFQILQPPGAVVILYEVQHEFRYIPLDGRPHTGSGIKSWLGSSRGRWEGNTLIVDVTNISGRVRMSSVGDFASDEVRMTERWHFVDVDTLELTVTIDDPNVFTRPWTVSKKIAREKDRTFEIMEYAGVEGDRDGTLMVEIPENVKDKDK
jgi:hypothetical protein